MANGVFEDYMSKFDILCLTETRIKTYFQFKGFKCITLNFDVAKYPYSVIHGINNFCVY